MIDWATNTTTFRDEALATQSRLESGDTDTILQIVNNAPKDTQDKIRDALDNRNSIHVDLQVVEPSRLVNTELPRMVNVGANEQTYEWKGRHIVYRFLMVGDKELKCAVYVDGDFENMYSYTSLCEALESAGVSVKQLNIVNFKNSKMFRDKSRYTRIFPII